MILRNSNIVSVILMFLIVGQTIAQSKHAKKSKYTSYKGLVMAGYQGWFNTPTDGANKGWTHYAKNGKFEDGSCTIDYWPDVSEYKKTYKTSFKYSDGSNAYVFSSYDESTVDLHFKWMKEYGIDGVFVQRFFSALTNKKRLNHNDKVLKSAIKSAKKYGIAISVMYDIGSMNDDKYKMVIEDWKHLVDDLKLTNQGKKTTYLYHHNKPLVAFWGIGFKERPSSHIPEIIDIMDFFKNDPKYGGCSIHLGVPAKWREQSGDAVDDKNFHTVLKQADIIHPWAVGRYNHKSYEKFRKNYIEGDVAWCKANSVDYVPTVFPGFSWYNMKEGAKSNHIPRLKGAFLWQQIYGAISSGAEMIYVAMFDEIDEGTAIIKVADRVPVGKSVFVPRAADIPSDHYLWITGMAGEMLRGEIPLSEAMPVRK